MQNFSFKIVESEKVPNNEIWLVKPSEITGFETLEVNGETVKVRVKYKMPRLVGKIVNVGEK